MNKLALAITCLCSSFSANAIGISGQGTWETTLQGRDLDGNLTTSEAYYDTALNITWLANANYAYTSGYWLYSGGQMDWSTANAWAAALNPYGSGITGWRLPTTNPIDGTTADDATVSYIGSEDLGYNVSAPGTLYAGSTTSEMAHLFYNTLGDKGYCNPTTSTVSSCSGPQAGWGLTNTGPFSNVQFNPYWSATEYVPITSNAWTFNFFFGFQNYNGNYISSDGRYAWAVHAGDVGTPVVADTDQDGVPDTADICPGGDDNVDGDGDSMPDFCDACPLDANNDGDEDGFCGDVDNCPLVANPDQADTDGDGVGNACNEAQDNDGDEWSNGLDNCPATANPTQANIDADSFGDACDSCPQDADNDADADGVCGNLDNCPLVANPDQADAPDNDGLGNACDADDDNDNVADGVDNCPLTSNGDQRDTDGDGQGDMCDDDADGDNVNDATDACLGTVPGAVVNAGGCAIAQLCPCDNDWKNKGAYVKCVTQAANDFQGAALIGSGDHGAIVSGAALSGCGVKQ